MNQFTKDELDTLISEGKTVVVDFYTTWCGPCKMFAPIFESAATKAGERAVFGKVDAEAESELAQRYGIMNVPTIMMFKDGEVAHKQSSIMTESAILELLG